MRQSNLINLVKQLSEEELRELSSFSSAVFHNASGRQKDGYRLLLLILERAPDFNDNLLDKENVHRYIYPDKAYKDIRIEKLMSLLYGHIRYFLLHQNYFDKENEFRQWFDLAGIWRKKGMELRYKQAIEKAQKVLVEKKEDSPRHFFQQFLLENEIHDWESTNNRNKGDINIPQVLINLDIFFYISKIDVLNRFLLQQKLANIELPDFLSGSAAGNIEVPEAYFEHSPLLSVTHKIYRLFQKKQPNFSDFEELRVLLSGIENNIQPQLLASLYTYLRNLCIILINRGNSELVPALHEIQKDNLNRGYFFENGKMSPSAYQSISRIAVLAKKYDWALEFIETYKDHLIDTHEKEVLYGYNYANYLFAIGEYEKAAGVLPETSSYAGYHLAIKRLEIKILYELQSDLADYKLDAFKMYVIRASKAVISQEMKAFQINFVNMLNQILNSLPGDKRRSETLLKRIAEKESVSEREWLLEKARALAG